jgi:hypothetical protein
MKLFYYFKHLYIHIYEYVYISRLYDSCLCSFACEQEVHKKVTLKFVLSIWFFILFLFSTGLHPCLCMYDPSVQLS